MTKTTQTKKLSRRKWKGTEQRSDDVFMPVKDARPDDIIILIMGPTGVGKSTFVNTATGKQETRVGHDLESCTSNIQHVVVPYPPDPSRRLVFVDTPGFDDTYVDDTEILRRIAVWLARSYSDEMKLTGVIYLHEISQTRMLGTTRKNFMMFHKLVGAEAARNVILTSTKWAHIKQEAGRNREEQLVATFWKEMIESGSRIARFLGTHESAWEIINLIVERNALEALHIQRELVDLGKLIPDTEAGNALRLTLQGLVETHKQTISRLHGRELDEGGNDDLQRKLHDTEKQLRELLSQVQNLKIPFYKRRFPFLRIFHC
ncbi:P-loop containing nucleoside triphosphate hydrolase protein, partial [Hygrophoropsis aurantiaca]